MTTANPADKPLPGNVVTSLEEAPDALTGGPDLVPVYAYRPDGKKYLIQMSPKDAERGGFELLNPPPEPEPEAKPKPKPKAKKPKDKSRTKATASDKSKTTAKDKTPSSSSK